MSTAFWRISNHVDLSGWGGMHFASRWSSKGRRVVYLAESPAGAMLEVLVHLKDRDGDLPPNFTLLEVISNREVRRIDLAPAADPAWADSAWKEKPELTRQLGDAWLESSETALARIPSAIVPRTWNWLLNPLHPEAGQLRVAEVIRDRFDTRLYHFGAR